MYLTHIIVLASSKNATWDFSFFFHSAMQLSAEDRSCRAQYHDADLKIMGVVQGLGTFPGCHGFPPKKSPGSLAKGAAIKTLIPIPFYWLVYRDPGSWILASEISTI